MHVYERIIALADDLRPILRNDRDALVLAAAQVHGRAATRIKTEIVYDFVRLLDSAGMARNEFDESISRLIHDGFLVRIGTQWIRPNTLLEAIATVANADGGSRSRRRQKPSPT